MQDVFALIAYEDPESSPVGQYMSDEYRDEAASVLNSAILGIWLPSFLALLDVLSFCLSVCLSFFLSFAQYHNHLSCF